MIKIYSTAYHTDLQSKLEEVPKVYKNFEETFVKAVDAHTPRKTKVLRGNHKLMLTRILVKPL